MQHPAQHVSVSRSGFQLWGGKRLQKFCAMSPIPGSLIAFQIYSNPLMAGIAYRQACSDKEDNLRASLQTITKTSCVRTQTLRNHS